MYLYLKQQNQQQFLVPCYDIDLMWHTHQVNTLHYSNDTTAILGFVLKHDDSVNDRWVDIIFEFKKTTTTFWSPVPIFCPTYYLYTMYMDLHLSLKVIILEYITQYISSFIINMWIKKHVYHDSTNILMVGSSIVSRARSCN